MICPADGIVTHCAPFLNLVAGFHAPHSLTKAFCHPVCRIARQVGTLYSEVAAGMLCPPLAQHFDRSWSDHVAVKFALYEVQALLDSAAALHADDKIGAEIARLKVHLSRRSAA